MFNKKQFKFKKFPLNILNDKVAFVISSGDSFIVQTSNYCSILLQTISKESNKQKVIHLFLISNKKFEIIFFTFENLNNSNKLFLICLVENNLYKLQIDSIVFSDEKEPTNVFSSFLQKTLFLKAKK